MNSLSKKDLKYIVSVSESQISKLSLGKLLLTGCTGVFGIWILETLLYAEQNYGLVFDCSVLSRNPHAFLKKYPQFKQLQEVTWIAGDIKTLELESKGFDFVLHGATTSAYETFSGENPVSKYETVVQGTRKILDLSVLNSVDKFLYISSGSVYGQMSPDEVSLIDESRTEAPITVDIGSALGHAKRSAEFICAAYSDRYPELDIKIARCFSFVGPYLPLDIHYAVGNFIGNAIRGEPIVIKGDGSAVRSYMYMADLVVWLFTIFMDGKKVDPYNVGSERGQSILQLAYLISEISGNSSPVVVKSEDIENIKFAASRFYIPSTLKARLGLNLFENYTIENALLSTFNFYKSKKI
jgi:nucleoside-diphosphate-sugar epimerase